MSDDPATFMAKTRAMLERAGAQTEQIAKVYTAKMVRIVVETTPGPNLQLPETEYYAVGRLRGAYTFHPTPIEVASRWEGGPLDEDGLGEVTWGRIQGEIMDQPLRPVAYLNNDVAYGYLVHYGGGRMPIARPWRDIAMLSQEVAAQEARLEVMAET